MVAAPIELLWAFIGLILTIGGTFLGASITSPPWSWDSSGIQAYPLGVTCQIGAVLLASCLGGRNAGVLSQIAYLALGLAGFPVFTQGGGFGYIREPMFGYLLGFVPGAWVCGSLAFKAPPRLEALTFSCLCGLLSVHLVGLVYLIVGYLFSWVNATSPLLEAVLKYSYYALPGQLALTCAVTVLAFTIRHLMFY
ncbi:biotin transporter BioY [Trichocoleus sp. FACHB-591]|nr:biotin transporter BioY [Trichocoleus sp. FACHB-46]MBD2095188.1 biotin transporter BioY [Trichocoleus sp. FACHB-591]